MQTLIENQVVSTFRVHKNQVTVVDVYGHAEEAEMKLCANMDHIEVRREKIGSDGYV